MNRGGRRWLPRRQLVLVVDGGLAAVRLGLYGAADSVGVTFVSRLRLAAAMYDDPLPQPRSTHGKKPQKGPRQPSLKSRLSSRPTVWETHEVAWYGGRQRVLDIATAKALWYRSGFDLLPSRWILLRDTLGNFPPAAFFAADQCATARPILAWVIARWGIEVTFEEVRAHLGFESLRTSPALLGRFSFVTLLAHHVSRSRPMPSRTAAWYHQT